MKREFLVSTAVVLCLAAAACSKTSTKTASAPGASTTTTTTTTSGTTDQSAATTTPSDQSAAATPPAGNQSSTGNYGSGTSTTADNTAASTDESSMPPPTSAQGFVQRAAMSDMYEIAASKALLAKSGVNQNVRDFAQKMVSAHTDTTKQIQAIATTDKLSLPSALDTSHQAMVDQITSADGPQAANIYLQQQTDAHQQALSLLQGYSTGGDDAKLKQFAQNITPTIQNHLADAKALESGSPPPNM